ncbi:MAG: MgtC/SapB family protein [Oscillospiraceae bacterium]|nr:MgtC/SapB family protein [Oscillospiraceae bacterium]
MDGLTIAPLTEWTALLRLAMSMIMGAALGLERSRKLRPAGLRTYMLVCIGACAMMITGLYLFDTKGPGFDPARLAAQVVSGIGFIGAGTIMVTSKHRVKGLTTAAGIWAVACLGIVVGVGFYAAAVGAFFLLLITMLFADRLEQSYYRRLRRVNVGIIVSSVSVLKDIKDTLEEHRIQVTGIEFADSVPEDGTQFSCVLRMERYMNHKELFDIIDAVEGVVLVENLDI